MSNAWGHRIAALSPAERERVEACACLPIGLYRCRRSTRRKPCNQPVRFLARYDYVTGRAGRVTDRKVYLCNEHAAEFCRKHKLECRQPAGE